VAGEEKCCSKEREGGWEGLKREKREIKTKRGGKREEEDGKRHRKPETNRSKNPLHTYLNSNGPDRLPQELEGVEQKKRTDSEKRTEKAIEGGIGRRKEGRKGK